MDINSRYSAEQLAHFKVIEQTLAEMNERAAQSGEVTDILPFSEEELTEYSRYCQLLLRERALSEED